MQDGRIKITHLLSILIMLHLLGGGVCCAQTADADTAFVQRGVKNALAAYKEKVGMQTHLYNGTEYVSAWKPYLEGNQFFASEEFTRGAIYYDHAWYQQVPMLYDVLTDEVVIIHNSSGKKMTLISTKVDTFQLHGHTFVRYSTASSGAAGLQPGFYDVLYNNSIGFLARRSKNIQERATSSGMEGEYRVGDKLYIRKNDAYYQVSSKRSVYKVLDDKKKQLRKYAAAHKLKFRKKREETILALVKYYSSLPDKTQRTSQ